MPAPRLERHATTPLSAAGPTAATIVTAPGTVVPSAAAPTNDQSCFDTCDDEADECNDDCDDDREDDEDDCDEDEDDCEDDCEDDYDRAMDAC
jgi:hypothetical protein